MTKIELKRIVELNNREVRTERDVITAEIIFRFVEKISSANGWEMADFFKEAQDVRPKV